MPRRSNTAAEFTSALCREEWLVENGGVEVKAAPGVPPVPSMQSLPSVSSMASISSMGGASDSTVADGLGPDGEELDPEALEAQLQEKAARKAEKDRIAADKALKKAERAKLKYSKRF